jgi:hypothetical protein
MKKLYLTIITLSLYSTAYAILPNRIPPDASKQGSQIDANFVYIDQNKLSKRDLTTGSVTISSLTVTNLSVSNLNTGGLTWQVVFSTDVETMVSSYTITGLNWTNGGVYKIDTCIAGSSSGGDFGIYFNGDKGATSYSEIRTYVGSTVNAAKGNAAYAYFGNYTSSYGAFTAMCYIKNVGGYPHLYDTFMGGSADNWFNTGEDMWSNPNNYTAITNATIYCIGAGITMKGTIIISALR